MEFLVHMRVTGFDSASDATRSLLEKEALRARELAAEGVLVRLWRVPGRMENWGIWKAETADRLHDALVSLPLFASLDITVHPLASHPNDPASGKMRAFGLDSAEAAEKGNRVD